MPALRYILALLDTHGDCSSVPAVQLVKRIWDYIKANDRQDPKNKRAFILDEKMSTIFTHPVNMFSMNKQVLILPTSRTRFSASPEQLLLTSL